MNDYDDVSIDDVMSADEIAEDDRRAEFALDAADEARAAAEQAATEAPVDANECAGGLIDGSWVHCPCEDCQDHLDTLDEDEQPW